MIIACFICSFYLGLAGEVGKTKLVLESGYGFGFGLVFVHIYSGRVEACRCHRVHMLRSEGKLGFQSTPSTTENARLASLQTSTDSLVSISHLSRRAPALQTITTVWSISPAPEDMIFKNIFLWPSAESRKHPASLPLHGATFIWHFWNISSNSEGRGGVWVSSRYQRWTRGWMRRGWCQLGLSSYCRVLLLLREPILASREV